MRLQPDRHPVQLGDRAEQGARVDVVREQAGGGGEHSGAEVADAELAQLTHQQGESQRREIDVDERDPVGFQDGPDGVQAADGGDAEPGRYEDHQVAVALQQAGRLGERALEVELLGRREYGGGRGVPVRGRQHQIGAGDSNGDRHAHPPFTRTSTGVPLTAAGARMLRDRKRSTPFPLAPAPYPRPS